MATEPGGILLSSAAGAVAAGGRFPREFERGLFGRFDRKFTLLLLVCIVLIFPVIAILSLRKPSQEVSEKEILKIQERYARLVLNQPKPEVAEVPEVVEEATVKTETVKKEEKKEEKVKVDREKETFVEKERRRESGVEERRQAREQAAKQVQAAGIFAAITASGSGSGGLASSTSDLLGTAGIGVADLGDLSVSKGTFATRDVAAADLVAKKGDRTTDVTIEKESVGRTAVTRVASAAQVNVTSQAPEVSGESSSMSERSQAAIQRVVSRESRRLKRLYEEWLKRDPALSGRLTVKFVILASGGVANVSVVKSSTNNSDFDAMVVRYIKRWKFPAVEGAGPVEVVYPFVFEGLS